MYVFININEYLRIQYNSLTVRSLDVSLRSRTPVETYNQF